MKRNPRSKQPQVGALLRFALADGDWHQSRELVARVRAVCDCHKKTVERAALALGVEMRRVPAGTASAIGENTRTLWRLPRSST